MGQRVRRRPVLEGRPADRVVGRAGGERRPRAALPPVTGGPRSRRSAYGAPYRSHGLPQCTPPPRNSKAMPWVCASTYPRTSWIGETPANGRPELPATSGYARSRSCAERERRARPATGSRLPPLVKAVSVALRRDGSPDRCRHPGRARPWAARRRRTGARRRRAGSGRGRWPGSGSGSPPRRAGSSRRPSRSGPGVERTRPRERCAVCAVVSAGSAIARPRRVGGWLDLRRGGRRVLRSARRSRRSRDERVLGAPGRRGGGPCLGRALCRTGARSAAACVASTAACPASRSPVRSARGRWWDGTGTVTHGGDRPPRRAGDGRRAAGRARVSSGSGCPDQRAVRPQVTSAGRRAGVESAAAARRSASASAGGTPRRQARRVIATPATGMSVVVQHRGGDAREARRDLAVLGRVAALAGLGEQRAQRRGGRAGAVARG